MSKMRIDASQIAITATKTTSAGSHSVVRRATVVTPPSPAEAPPLREAGARRAGASSSRTSLTSSKKRGSSRVSAVRGDGRSISTAPAMRPGRGLITIDARRQEHCLGDRVRDEDHCRLELLPDREELEVQPFARHLVERAERLVHQQERRLERERSRDRNALLHAAGELPRMVVAEVAAARRARASRRRAACAARGPSRATRAAARCSSHTVRQSKSTASWKTIP